MPARRNKPAGHYVREKNGAFTDMTATTATTAELEAIAQELDATATPTAPTAPDTAVVTVSDTPVPALNGRTQFGAKSNNPLVIKTESGRVKWRLLGTPDEHGFYTMA